MAAGTAVTPKGKGRSPAQTHPPSDFFRSGRSKVGYDQKGFLPSSEEIIADVSDESIIDSFNIRELQY
ncbi:hypothetical protein ACFW16_17130 [Inquilinus sp. NPDC058860]|uniref:hypothetical protein n=1 Tax=Inquilinus sp. NPDC058860 TaxID=3346652 RepID=UPI0036BC726A